MDPGNDIITEKGPLPRFTRSLFFMDTTSCYIPTGMNQPGSVLKFEKYLKQIIKRKDPSSGYSRNHLY